MKDRLFLLLNDDDSLYGMGWYLHCVFDDNENSWRTIEDIVRHGCTYRVIKGSIVKEFFGEDF